MKKVPKTAARFVVLLSALALGRPTPASSVVWPSGTYRAVDMSKRKRGGSGSAQEEPVRKDHIVINVGGTRFTTSVSTLTGSSTYFEALFSRWDDDDKEPEIFLDRDPDAFRVILSCN